MSSIRVSAEKLLQAQGPEFDCLVVFERDTVDGMRQADYAQGVKDGEARASVPDTEEDS